jgi:hypothetical protein
MVVWKGSRRDDGTQSTSEKMETGFSIAVRVQQKRRSWGQT